MDDINQQLHDAASRGKIKDVTKLLKQGSNINQTDKDGNTSLHNAVKKGHRTVTEYLINQGADVEKATPDGQTPLHLAASLGRLKSTKVIVSHGAIMDKEDEDGYSALYIAVRNGDLRGVRYFFSQGAKVNQGNTKGWTPLSIAAIYGQIKVVKYLISEGAEVNQGDNEGTAALHVAAQKGHLDVTKYLVSQGAEVNRGTNEGTAALHVAAQEGHLDVTKYLVSQGAEVNRGNNEGTAALHVAAYQGHLDVTKYLISQGADVNRGNNEGYNALRSAAFNGHLDVTKYLISQGADVNQGDNEGRAALHVTAQEGHIDVTKYLISRGAEFNKGDNGGTAALYFAAQEGHLDITKYLISQGAVVNRGNNEGYIALHSAASNGHIDVTKLLISQGAQVNSGNNEGLTALRSAAFNGHLDVTKYLISEGAEVNGGNNDGRTALHHAVQNGYLDVVQVLMTGGARFDIGDIHGQTPLHLSLILGYESIADLFMDRSNSKLDQNDLTDISLAIQCGHTSTIEKLVSEGADLNIQSPDGQTCLHKAIKLCYNSEKIVQESDTLSKISDEYYRGELSPERALVFYLLENGAKLDVKDERGNLPIQYAKDEVVKQMILWRLPSLEEIKYHRDEPSTPAIVSVEVEINTSQEVELEDHGVSMFIPPEAVHHNDPCKITLTLLRDLPSVDIQYDESLVCYGIRCDPPNMIFHQPVKIRIPHSTLTINPDQVKPDIVSHVWDSVNDLPRISRMISSSSPDEPPYCRMYKRHLELYIGHCAVWWVLIPLEQQVIRHQRMCTPYIPYTIEKGKEIEVHLYVHANLPGMDAEVEEEEKKQSYRKVHPSVPISIATKSGDVQVTCFCQDEIEQRKFGPKVLPLKDVQSKLKHSIILPVTSREEDTDFPVTIRITQAGNVGVSISVSFLIRYSDELKYEPSLEPASFVRVIEEVSKSDLEDIDVHTIAEKMTVDQFYDLGVALGFPIQQLDVIEYKRFRDRQLASYDMLVTWRQAQASGQEAKETLLSLMKYLDSPAEEMEINGLPMTI